MIKPEAYGIPGVSDAMQGWLAKAAETSAASSGAFVIHVMPVDAPPRVLVRADIDGGNIIGHEHQDVSIPDALLNPLAVPQAIDAVAGRAKVYKFKGGY